MRSICMPKKAFALVMCEERKLSQVVFNQKSWWFVGNVDSVSAGLIHLTWNRGT